MPSNDWVVGGLYPYPKGLNGVDWQQPAGLGTQVFPAPVTGTDYFSTQAFSELSGVFRPGCGHSVNAPLVQREWDYVNDTSVALICCPECGFLAYIMSPFEAALNTVYQPQLPI